MPLSCWYSVFFSYAAGANVQVQLHSLDGRRFTAEEAGQPIWFGEVAVGARQHRVVRVSNPTPLPLPFCWQQTDHPVSSGKLLTVLHSTHLFPTRPASSFATDACLPDQASLAPLHTQSLLT